MTAGLLTGLQILRWLQDLMTVSKRRSFFFDADSLRWFMMDSLWRTLTENLNTENIYYTMDGGRELAFEGDMVLAPVSVFPPAIPYMRSDFYFAHDDVRGDEENLMSAPRTCGDWTGRQIQPVSRWMASVGLPCIMPAERWKLPVILAGYLDCADEYENGDFRYDLYTAEDKWIASFYFDSDTQFHLLAGRIKLRQAFSSM